MKPLGRPPLMASRVDLRLSVSSDLRERLRAESRRTGESEAEIGRQAIEAELKKRADAVWFHDKLARGENAGYIINQRMPKGTPPIGTLTEEEIDEWTRTGVSPTR